VQPEDRALRQHSKQKRRNLSLTTSSSRATNSSLHACEAQL
jgi:hypothetical protein